MKTILCFGDSLTWGFMAGTWTRHAFEDRWPNMLAAGLEVQLEHQVGPLVQSPRQTRRGARGHLAWLPTQELAVRTQRRAGRWSCIRHAVRRRAPQFKNASVRVHRSADHLRDGCIDIRRLRPCLEVKKVRQIRDVPVPDVQRWAKEFLEFVDGRFPQLQKDIDAKRELTNEIKAALNKAITEFNEIFKASAKAA